MPYSINLSFVSEIDTLLSHAIGKNISNGEGEGEGASMAVTRRDRITLNFFIVIFSSRTPREWEEG